MANDDGSAARRFHRATKHSLESLQRGPQGLDWDNMPLPFKIYRGIAGEALPASSAPTGISVGDAIAGRAPLRQAGETPDRGALARLLRFSLGVIHKKRLTEGGWHFFRAAPCTGALYHIDAYVIAGELADLAAGVYHFAPHDFALRRLREGDWRPLLVEAAAGHAAIVEAPVTLVLASTYWRNAWKYRRRAYRHVFWDGGAILAQLLAEAAADGWPASVVLGFADGAVETLCGLDAEREGIVCLVALGSGRKVSGTVTRPPSIELETEPLSARELDYPEIRDVHAHGALETGAEASGWRSRATASNIAPPSAPFVELPAADGPRDPLEQVIGRRGSTRFFSRRPISLPALATLLHSASAPVLADYRADATRALVDLYLVVNAVDGLEPGAYRWHAGRSGLECIWRGERRRDAGFLALGQALGGEAAVDVYAISDLDEVLGRLGSRGYRAATLDGAVAGGRIYLAAYAQHFGATGLTFFDDDVARFFGLDAERYGVMFLTAAGYSVGRKG